jgi:hypothetical protein
VKRETVRGTSNWAPCAAAAKYCEFDAAEASTSKHHTNSSKLRVHGWQEEEEVMEEV